MIAFDLQCSKGHTFEGWFDDRAAFDEQRKQGLVTCPICDDANVMIVPSTFAIPKAGKVSTPTTKPRQSRNLAVGELSEKLVEFMEQNFDDVGTNFAKEALKIHYGVSEPRNIRGVSSPEEEKILEKEGVSLFKVPLPVKKETDDA
ncbi:MAG: DUF1178 family protein [Desulfobacterales bacterium]|nr:DUF1178 family protein [Desulfobacterales bacterium]